MRWAGTWLLGLALLAGQVQAQKIKVGGKRCVPDPSCEEGTTFEDSITTGVRSRLWDFGDPGSTTDTSSRLLGRYVYKTPGRYTARVTRTLTNGTTTRDSVTFTIGVPPRPFQNWRNDTTICQGQTITLDPYPNGAPPGVTYLWYPKGDTTQTIQVDSSGCYSVEAFDSSGCSFEDRINVKVCYEQPQQQGAKWHFGNNAGLDFAGGGSPSPIEDSKLNTVEGASSISNTKGQLLFYTDGLVIFDRDGNQMPSLIPGDTVKLGGNQRSTQAALIVPQPTCRGCEYLYRVYTTTEINGTRVLTYSVVDMRRNKGKGAIVEKNVPLAQNATERIASVRNDRDTTYWVISRDFGSNTFRVYHMTKTGLSEPKTYNLGSVQDTTTQGEGYLKIGPADTTGNGNRPMAMIVPGPPRNYVELYTFNDSTGVITPGPRIDIGPAPPKAYGVEFSPNGQKLYVSYLGDSTRASQIVSYDISSPDSSAIAQSRSVLDSTTTRQYGALQIGSDGRIYVAVKGAGALGVIENPNDELLSGGAVFTPEGAPLGGKNSQLGLPNFVANFNESSNQAGFSYADTCAGSPTNFQTSPFCPPLKDTYTWNFGDNTAPVSGTATQQQHTYREPGTYSVSLRIVTRKSDGGVCKDTTITQQLTIVRTPDPANLGPDRDTCGTSLTIDAKTQASRYIWIYRGRVIRGYNSRTLTVTHTGAFRSGRYIVIAANGGCFQVDTIQVTLRRPPAFSLGPDTTFCQGRSVTLNASGNSWTSYDWSNGSKERSVTIDRPGTYSVRVFSETTKCENRDTVVVRSLPRPVVTARLTPPTGCTIADGSIQLQAGPAAPRRFDWQNADNVPLGDTSGVLRSVPDGTYRVRVTDVNNCVTDTSFALRSANSLNGQAATTTARCTEPLSGAIEVVFTRGNPTQFVWTDRSGNIVGNGSALRGVNSGLYRFEARDNGGCVFRLDSIFVAADTTGFVNLGPDRGQCVGDTLVLRSLQPNVAGDTYQWSSGQNSPTITVNTPGTYRLTVRNDLTGCRGSDAITVSFTQRPVVEAGPNLDVCLTQQSVQLSGATPGGGFWTGRGVDSTGRFTPTDSLVGASPLVLFYTVSQNGCVASDRRVLFVQRPPVVELGPDTTLCPSPTLRLRAPIGANTTYVWSTGATTASIPVASPGTYAVTVIRGACTVSDQVQIAFQALPIFQLPEEAPLCAEENGVAAIRVTGDRRLTYLWPHSGETTPSVSVNRLGSYTVQVTNDVGCTREDTVQVVDRCEPRVFVPDAFSPNGDGINDRLDIYTAHITDFELKIYNRWGEVIFATNDPEQKWDGVYRGVKYPPMVYAYLISYKSEYYPERAPSVVRGSVLLLK